MHRAGDVEAVDEHHHRTGSGIGVFDGGSVDGPSSVNTATKPWCWRGRVPTLLIAGHRPVIRCSSSWTRSTWLRSKRCATEKKLPAKEMTAVHFVLDATRAAQLQRRWDDFGFDTHAFCVNLCG
jgi:hypothetical protein